MPPLDTAVIVLAGIAFLAAFVNGALGYGFSSLTVPVALVFYANRILNPAVVLVEVATNFYVLFINLNGVAAVWKRVFPIIIGLLPGIGIGALVLASVQPGWIKLGTYALILPLILVQAAGLRRPVRQTWWVGLPFGTALGILYSVTTISGPPLAILFNNQGLVKTEFRAGLALVRVAESSVTAIVYYQLGLFTAEIGNIFWVFVPCVAVGVPLGAYVIRHLDAETFRRICMSFDAWVVGFGFSRVLIELNLMQSPWAYVALVLTFLIDSYLLYMFFTRRAASRRSERTLLTPGAPSGPDNRIASEMTEPPYDPLARLNTDLGYVVAILAIAMLVFAVLPPIRLP
ncbi:sulfite exporter TauE/SafE family protein [Bradyrhizobium sp. AZCC 2289]|uniref:sulfite exporter TauE/SafE family protein n=1 Tax=Bradyrhizobium sp. AZCC 2289 TaxID=3117026 RepID=UPI002FEEA2B8